uniref:TonB-dependent receptor n=1 Tax=Pedobacter schmidteae TaxID=2201271 RepID=UPI000EB2482A|nr:TonB-dependent receptor [Pedobacter schmidteae]
MLRSTTRGTILLLLLISLFATQQLKAQMKRVVTGTVQDSTNLPIPSAHVRLISGKDTLNRSADNEGRFSFSGISSPNFDILIRGIGYKAFSGSYTFDAKQTEFALDAIVLKAETQMLNEVVINGKIRPIRVMKDTIEYNAGAYVVRENDHVEDLLKQLPGMEVDEKGKVTSLGKELTKIRVNGKDFFTGNVKEFIKQLPADIFSHLQVIDDYGDEANFTGIKVGEPKKILNLVTKPDRNKGRFGSAGGSAGTNKRYGLNVVGNMWEGDQQIGLNSFLSNANNSGGQSRDFSLGANIRKPLAKGLSMSGGYTFNQNRSENERQSYIETVNELGTIYNDSFNRSKQSGGNHNLNLDINGMLLKNYFNASINGSLSSNSSVNHSSSLQTGVIKQDLINDNGVSGNSPGLSANLAWGKKFGKKRKRTVLMNFNTNLNKTNNNEDITTTTSYYDKITGDLVKDSLLNRIVDTRNVSNSFNAGFSFSEPLTRADDTVKRKSIDVNYAVTLTSTHNNLQTNVRDKLGQAHYVDSLSNIYTSLFINQNLRLSYRYNAKKFDYSIGVSAQPSTLTGSYEGRDDKVRQNTLNFSPTADARFLLSQSQSVNFSYNGYTNAPSFEQLRPVPDTRNLQNVIIGNPDLKTAFTHSVNLSYRLFGSTTGRALQIGFNGNVIQNQVASNVILIPDTLNGLKQETRFENANGNYNFGSNYSLSLPFAKRKYSLSANGNLGYTNAVVFTDNVKNFNSGINFSQSVQASMNTKKLSMSTAVNYSYSVNDYSLATVKSRNIENWSFSLQSRVVASKFLSANVTATKRINNGYALNSTNPLLIGASIDTFFLKNRMATLSLQANDLLNQGNTLDRVVDNNSIIDSRSNQVTRYIVMNFSMRLQNFGGKKKS